MKKHTAMLNKPNNSPRRKPKKSALAINCVDARVNPNHEIGLIDFDLIRTIGAIVPRYIEGIENIKETDDPKIRNVQDFNKALNDALANPDMRHIINMPHTHCGGVCACHCGAYENTLHIKDHLEPIVHLREQYPFEEPTNNENAVARDARNEIQQRAFEAAVAKENLKNLLTYPQVKKAVEDGKIELHGWLLDTTTHRIMEVQKDARGMPLFDKDLKAMKPLEHITDEDYIVQQVRFKQQPIFLEPEGPPPPHNPERLLMADKEPISPLQAFNIPYGKSLIYRNELGIGKALTSSQLAAIEFALTFPGKDPKNKDGLKEILLMGHFDSSKETLEQAHDLARHRIDRARKYVDEMVRKLQVKGSFRHNDPITIKSWVIDTHTNKRYKLGEKDAGLTPLAIKGIGAVNLS